MAKNLQQEIDAGVRRVLAGLGISVPAPVSDDPADQPGYIAFGSPEHVRFVGLKTVEEGDDVTGFTVYTSPESGVTYRLEDEIGVLAHFPGVDPDKAALLALRQKVNEVESGAPPVPERAPRLWQPVDQYTALVGGGQ